MVEDSLALARSGFRDVFEIEVGAVGSQRTLDALAWSDNLATVSSCLSSACNNMLCWRHFLRTQFHCDVKPDSLEVIPASTRSQGERMEQVGGVTWVVRDKAKCLGSWLTATGEDRSDRQALMCAWNRAFWANARIFLNRRASVWSRVRVWKSLAFSVSDHFLAGIRPSVSSDDGLSAYFNKFVHRILSLRRSEDETPASFVIRRNHQTARVKLSASVDIRFRHAYKLCTWVEHMFRHTDRPSFHLIQSQDDTWLETCRYLANRFSSTRTATAGETGTRSGPGHPLRWGGVWLASVSEHFGGWGNEAKDRAVTKAKASFVVQHFMHKPSARLALMDS